MESREEWGVPKSSPINNPEESKSNVRSCPKMSVKRTRNTAPTYFQFIQQVLSKHDPQQSRSTTLEQKPYLLHEDLELILNICKSGTNINAALFDRIASEEVISRTSRSMQKRYAETLWLIGQQETKEIVDHIFTHGIEGYIIRENYQIAVSLVEPETNLSCRESSSEEILLIRKVDKADIQHNSQDLTNELTEVLLCYEKVSGVKMVDLLESLDRLSGSLPLLDLWIETGDESLKWSKEEDVALQQDDPLLERFLSKYKGTFNVQLRKRYLESDTL